MGKFMRFGVLALVLVVSSIPSFADSASVITDTGCTIGWIGCPVDDADPVGDGNWTCSFDVIGIVGITGTGMEVVPGDVHENSFAKCQTQIEFGQPNPTGAGGLGGDVIAVDPDFICLLFPDACQGNGAVVINPRTIGAVGDCTIRGAVTRNFQSQVTPSGKANLTCFLPDPPQGE